MEAYELDKIKVLATSFRGAIEIAKDAGEFDNDFAFPRFPKGCCGDTSDLLAEYLAQHDIYTYYVCGQKGTQSHAWLVLVNTVTVTTDNSDADRKYKSLISVYNEDNDVIIKNHHVAEDGETFDLYFKDKLFDTFTIPVYGKHMVLNATAAIIMCNIYGISKEQIKNSFKTFKNAKRRFAEEKVGNAIIIDDYAHHPTEISATLDAVKRKYKDRRVVAVFKPNTYSRTKDFTNEFVTALSKADKVYLTEIDCNRERQSDYPGVTSNLIVEKIKGAEIISEDTIDKLKNEKDSVVCFMSCAYVNHLIDAFKEIIK